MDTTGAADLSANQPVERPEPGGVQAVTAFVTFQGMDGSWHVTPDLNIAGRLSCQRLASSDDLYAGSSVVCKDVAAAEAAQAVVARQAAFAQQQSERQAVEDQFARLRRNAADNRNR